MLWLEVIFFIVPLVNVKAVDDFVQNNGRVLQPIQGVPRPLPRPIIVRPASVPQNEEIRIVENPTIPEGENQPYQYDLPHQTHQKFLPLLRHGPLQVNQQFDTENVALKQTSPPPPRSGLISIPLTMSNQIQLVSTSTPSPALIVTENNEAVIVTQKSEPADVTALDPIEILLPDTQKPSGDHEMEIIKEKPKPVIEIPNSKPPKEYTIINKPIPGPSESKFVNKNVLADIETESRKPTPPSKSFQNYEMSSDTQAVTDIQPPAEVPSSSLYPRVPLVNEPGPVIMEEVTVNPTQSLAMKPQVVVENKPVILVANKDDEETEISAAGVNLESKLSNKPDTTASSFNDVIVYPTQPRQPLNPVPVPTIVQPVSVAVQPVATYPTQPRQPLNPVPVPTIVQPVPVAVQPVATYPTQPRQPLNPVPVPTIVQPVPVAIQPIATNPTQPRQPLNPVPVPTIVRPVLNAVQPVVTKPVLKPNPKSITIASFPKPTQIPSYYSKSPLVPPTSSRPIVNAIATQLMDFECRDSNGYFGIQQDCDSYIECQKRIAYKFQCPDGLHFNRNAVWPEYPCDYPWEAKCEINAIERVPQPTSECPRQYGYFAVQGDCSNYIMCQEGIATIMSCPIGLVFNPSKYICDWPENVPSCKPIVFSGFTCPSVNIEDEELITKFRYSDSCKEYVACQRGQPRLLSCDAGLAFDEQLQICVDADYVKNCKY